MKNNLKEELIFSAMMTFGMVLVMLSFNVILAVGFNDTALLSVLTNLLPVFVIAFVVELLLVAHNVKKVHKIIVAPDDPKIKYVLVMAVLMVLGMCAAMSLYATLVNHGTGPDFWATYLLTFGRNLPVALVAQLIVVSPAVRLLHGRMFRVRRASS